MLKTNLRKLYLQKRKQLGAAEMQTANERILQQFSQLNFYGVNTIHVFIPIVNQNEPNTFLIIDWLQQNHPLIQIVVSRSNFSNYSMTCHPYLGKTDLKESEYHIPEPQTHSIFNGKIDLVLVPLLAFDKQGFRVGYGKGFYDRFLAMHDSQTIGISIFDPIDCIDDLHSDDIRLDKCITPNQIFSFVD